MLTLLRSCLKSRSSSFLSQVQSFSKYVFCMGRNCMQHPFQRRWAPCMPVWAMDKLRHRDYVIRYWEHVWPRLSSPKCDIFFAPPLVFNRGVVRLHYHDMSGFRTDQNDRKIFATRFRLYTKAICLTHDILKRFALNDWLLACVVEQTWSNADGMRLEAAGCTALYSCASALWRCIAMATTTAIPSFTIAPRLWDWSQATSGAKALTFKIHPKRHNRLLQKPLQVH